MDKIRLMELAGVQLNEGEKFKDCSHMLRSLMSELHSAIRNAKTDSDFESFFNDIEDVYKSYADAEVKVK